jgi:hypothetical protein
MRDRFLSFILTTNLSISLKVYAIMSSMPFRLSWQGKKDFEFHEYLTVCFVECVHEEGKKLRDTKRRKKSYEILFLFAHGKKTYFKQKKRNSKTFSFPLESLRNVLCRHKPCRNYDMFTAHANKSSEIWV